MVFLGGYPAKYRPSAFVCVVYVCVCVLLCQTLDIATNPGDYAIICSYMHPSMPHKACDGPLWLETRNVLFHRDEFKFSLEISTLTFTQFNVVEMSSYVSESRIEPLKVTRLNEHHDHFDIILADLISFSDVQEAIYSSEWFSSLLSHSNTIVQEYRYNHINQLFSLRRNSTW